LRNHESLHCQEIPFSTLECVQCPPPLPVLRQRGQVTCLYPCFFKIRSISTLRYTPRFLNSFRPPPPPFRTGFCIYVYIFCACCISQTISSPFIDDPRKVEGTYYEASYSVRSILPSSDDQVFLWATCLQIQSICFSTMDHVSNPLYPLFLLIMIIIIIIVIIIIFLRNYLGILLCVFYVSSLLYVVVCVLMFCCFCYWLLNQLINILII